ncbi:hypothetical protein J6V85_03290 [Candidatus Saccharibacteria bacterium]|nr:hypothetical protein [Candidatus Saccharibacteria bacterium]
MVINGKEYQDKNIDFNFICNLEEAGISLEGLDKRPMSFIRFYVAHCMGVSVEDAGAEMEQHLIDGGDFADIMKIFTEKMNESDFFQAMIRKGKSTPKRKPKKQDQ